MYEICLANARTYLWLYNLLGDADSLRMAKEAALLAKYIKEREAEITKEFNTAA